MREYKVTLGDNPSVSSGAPLSLGWRYDPRERVVSLVDEEAKDGLSPDGGDDRDDNNRGANGGGGGGGRAIARSRWQLRLSDRKQ